MTLQGAAVKSACVEVREELNRQTAKLLGREQARLMEAQLEAMTQLFTELAAES